MISICSYIFVIDVFHKKYNNFFNWEADYIIEKEPLVNKFISRQKDKGKFFISFCDTSFGIFISLSCTDFSVNWIVGLFHILKLKRTSKNIFSLSIVWDKRLD